MKLFLFLKWFLRARYFWVFYNRDELINHQEVQLRKYKKYLNRKFYNGQKILEREKKKYITKQIIQDNFTDFNVYRFDKVFCVEKAKVDEQEAKSKSFSKELSFGLSSGTSGSRGVFISSKKEQVIWAAIILAKMLPGKMLAKVFNPFSHKLKISLFLRSNNNLYKSINKFGLSLDFYDLNENIEININKIADKEIDILVAPASVLLILAKKLETHQIKIMPKLVISVAEVLEKKEYITSQFNQKIHEIYQCTEGLLATTCKNGSLHLNEGFIKFEEEKIDDTRFIPIITDFTRKSQFYVDYLHEDVLVKAKPCACGDVSLTLEKIEGRSDEVLNFGNRVIFPDSIRKVFFSTKIEVHDFILKKQDTNLQIYLNPNKEDLQKEIIVGMNKLLSDYELDISKFEYEFFDYERKDYSIKSKRIININ